MLFDKIRSDTLQTEPYNHALHSISGGAGLEETFGKKLAKWRKAKNKNQAELARALEVSPTYISYLERDINPSAKDGKAQPSLELVDNIARVLSVPPAEVRVAAGYAPAEKTGGLGHGERAAEFVSALPPERKEDALMILEAFYRKYAAGDIPAAVPRRRKKGKAGS